jgi:hypothetical protein
MTSEWDAIAPLLSGPLASAGGPWPLVLRARLCDLRPRFLPKGAIRRGHRAIARNGRVLLCADQPPDKLAGRKALVRLQTWHRTILSGDEPQPYGVLLWVRCLEDADEQPPFTARLVGGTVRGGDLAIDVGGGMFLEFHAGGKMRTATEDT